jgi:RHS repeat-associated protein
VAEETLPGMGAVLGNVYSHGALISRLQNGAPVLSQLKYDPAGAMTEIDFATGEVEKIALDQYERPIGFNFSDPGNVQRWGNGSFADPNLPYQYDGAGNITSIGSAQGVSDNFTYDLLSRLTGATVNRQGYAHAYSYAYDDFGNLVGRTEVPANGAESLKASLVNTAAYRTPTQAPDETAAANYIKEVAFSAQLATGSNGVTNNRLSSVQRGGTLEMGGTQYATGIGSSTASMAYDANGNLIDDGKYLYGYDALNRQVAVWNRDASQTDNKGALVAEYAYLASGERIAALKYSGGEVSDYTRYVREGGAVVWEKSDSTGHEKRYIYAGGRMAYTEEAWVTCTLPKLASSPTQSLASLQVAPDANGQTVTATIALPGLPEEAQAAEVRLVKGNSLVASQRIDRPEGGQWCGVEQATFAGLVEGSDYQAGITLLFRENRAKIMPLKAYLVQRMKLGIVKGKLAAWTIKRLKADNDNVSEETTTGFAGLAPENAEDYTALVAQGGEMQAVAQGQQADNAEVPAGANSVSVQGSAGTSVSLAAPSLGTTSLRPGGGIIVPQCTKHALNTYYATDHLGTVRFTKTVDDTGAVTTTTHDYEPFGVEITPTDECDNTHKFTGHERDAETQNDYMHFRFFSASMGRFQKPDSVFGSPLNPQGWNLYSYVHGNPVNYNDPTGHWYRVHGEKSQVGRSHDGTSPGYPPEYFLGDMTTNVSDEFVWSMAELEDYLWGGAKILGRNDRTVSQMKQMLSDAGFSQAAIAKAAASDQPLSALIPVVQVYRVSGIPGHLAITATVGGETIWWSHGGDTSWYGKIDPITHKPYDAKEFIAHYTSQGYSVSVYTLDLTFDQAVGVGWEINKRLHYYKDGRALPKAGMGYEYRPFGYQCTVSVGDILYHAGVITAKMFAGFPYEYGFYLWWLSSDVEQYKPSR